MVAVGWGGRSRGGSRGGQSYWGLAVSLCVLSEALCVFAPRLVGLPLSLVASGNLPAHLVAQSSKTEGQKKLQHLHDLALEVA